MFLSAASVTLALAFANGIQLGPAENAAWARISPSVVILLSGDSPKGTAALIDAAGLFVAHRESVPSAPIRGRTSSGSPIAFTVESSDEPSQMVLLRARAWSSGASPIAAAVREAAPGERLLAALGTGPIRAEFVSSDRVGVLNPSRRVVQLNEIRFEAPPQSVAGALVFTLRGELVGALNATLEQMDEAPQKNAFGAAGGILPKTLGRVEQRFGPAPLTVAYTVGPVALRRVLEGFRSPSHEVVHPSLGVFCRDAQGTGAVVEMVTAGSSAHLAGLRPGDIVFQLCGEPVNNQIDFAKIVFEQTVGAIIPMRVRRGATTILMLVKVGRASRPEPGEQSLVRAVRPPRSTGGSLERTGSPG